MRRRAKISFRKASLQALCGDYVSPGRGWYYIYTFRPDQQDEEQLRWLPFEEHETIALLRLDIGAFRSSSIDDKTLAFILPSVLACMTAGISSIRNPRRIIWMIIFASGYRSSKCLYFE